MIFGDTLSERNKATWVLKTGTTILEQGFLSGTNFLISLLMGRWLSPVEFGAFSIAYTVYLFFSGVQNSLILEPMSVLGPSKYKGQMEIYLKHNSTLNILLWIIIALILLMSSFLVRDVNNLISSAMIGLSIACPFIAIYSLIRRRIYVMLSPHIALGGAIIYAITTLLLLAYLYRSQLLSPELAFITLGISSFCAFLFCLIAARTSIPKLSSNVYALGLKEVMSRNWEYGGWILAGTVVFWFVYLSYIPLTGMLLDLDSAGVYKAVQNLTVPVDRILSGFGLLLLPALSFRLASTGLRDVLKISGIISVVSAIIGLLYLVGISIFREEIMQLIYGNEFYTGFSNLVPIMGFVSILNAFGFGFAHGLRAAGKTKKIFLSLFWGALATFLFSYPATYYFGLKGAVASQAFSAVLSTGIIIFFWWRLADSLHERKMV